MKKHLYRREFLKLKSNKTYEECKNELEVKFGRKFSIRTLKRWNKRFLTTEWDLNDNTQRPKRICKKFDEDVKRIVVDSRKRYGYSAHQLRIKLEEKEIFMSVSYIKKIIREVGLSRGNKMEGIKLKWVRFERNDSNDMWQIDGTELSNARQLVIVEDDYSRYCVGVMVFDTLTTNNMILLLESCIKMHGKPREILTDNGHEFGGIWKDSLFDEWCNRQGIKHIRAGIHKPTTLGKIGAIQQTYFREISYCGNDLEAWRYRYNFERPHRSLRGLAPNKVYFGFKRHKKHYDL